ncbi:hypothetical protein BIFBIF_00599 [Bifidobacterium bifidum ATCC 29521 = JCM 1255 = DSM 20456]|nr:hypothetical protein BIFBIF_00599 [Bifidobacterium bifidum ATCC 29521 = JCM 1255 = DSM 20456]
MPDGPGDDGRAENHPFGRGHDGTIRCVIDSVIDWRDRLW